MEVLVSRVAGLDVHKDSVVACVLSGAADGPVSKVVRTFGTTTRDLLELKDWLESLGVQRAVVEATGVYWRPVFNVLQEDEELDLVLANPYRIKNVPGRKTDVLDAEWIAQLARHGLVSASFVPPRPIQELRDLVRYRKKLVIALGSEKNRIQKVLEDANIKLGSVVTDILGDSSRAMLEAVVGGESDPMRLSDHARGKLCRKREALQLALQGRPTAVHRFLLGTILKHVDFLEGAIGSVEAEIQHRLEAHTDAVARLCTIPGVSDTVASGLIAEMGADMSVFPSADHAASWAGLAPGSHESAGKKRSARTRRGRGWLKSLLCEAAWGAIRTKNSYLRAKFHKLRARRGPQRALLAIARKILVAAYWILRTGQTYHELGTTSTDSISSEDKQPHPRPGDSRL